MPSEMLPRAELDRILATEAPFSEHYGFVVEDYSAGTARVRLPYDDRHIRPGGTISGPSMFALADFAMYIAVMGAIGPQALAVTTNMSIDFLRKPAEADLIAEVELLKLGKRLAVGRIDIRAEGDSELCAHVTGTYSIPPR
ncbi:MAG: PaaI family thioesterase [Alphaproteobacteria bacterium]|nr:PaaI family thioesterase [Alphaproteobacteria bacterium]